MKKSSGGNRKKCRAWKITRNILLGVIGLWAVILIILQIVLTPGVLTNLANNFAAGMVDGNVTFGKVRASVFKHFPYLDVTFDSLAVTYPSDRFEAYGAGKDWYTSQGRGETLQQAVCINQSFQPDSRTDKRSAHLARKAPDIRHIIQRQHSHMEYPQVHEHCVGRRGYRLCRTA